MNPGKKMLVGAALSVFLLPLAARAEVSWSPTAPPVQTAAILPGEPAPNGLGGWRDRRDRGGRWEQRTVQQWVEGRHQQVWVPERCFTAERSRGWRRRAGVRCAPAHWEQRWEPGHYEQVARWVWVPFDGRGHGDGQECRHGDH